MKWISVTEDLPDSSEDIKRRGQWVWIAGNPGYVGMADYEKFGQGSAWVMRWPKQQDDRHSWVITHWMPLPDPPEGE